MIETWGFCEDLPLEPPHDPIAYIYGRFQSKTAFQPLKCPQIPFSPSFAVTKPLMLSSIPFKTINIIPFWSQKCKKNWKDFFLNIWKSAIFQIWKISDFQIFFSKSSQFFFRFFLLFWDQNGIIFIFILLYYYIYIIFKRNRWYL